jgi:nucleoid-associated protein YgaU
VAAAGDRVVVRGDCLWHIAADSLLGRLGRLPDDPEVAAAVDTWWRANADVIGPDPDLLLPGQVLRDPGPP